MPGSESPDSKGRKQQSAPAPSTTARDQEGPPDGLQVSVELAKPEDALDLWNLLSEIAKESKKHKIYENKIIFNEEDEEKRVTINKAANGSISFNTETPATSKSVNEVVGLLTKLAAKSKKPITFTINDGSLKHVQKLLKKLESSDVRVVFSADYIKKLQRLSQTGTVGPWGEREIAKQLLERHRQQSLAQQRSSVLPMSEQAPNATSVNPHPANSLRTPRRPAGIMQQDAAGGGDSAPSLQEQASAIPETREQAPAPATTAAEPSIDQAEQEELRGQLQARIREVNKYVRNIENPVEYRTQLTKLQPILEDMQRQVEETGGLKPEQYKQLKELHAEIDSKITPPHPQLKL